LGRTARWTHDQLATVDSHVTIIRFDADKVDPVCAGFALLRLESQIEDFAEGSTGQTELKRELLGSLHLELPDPADQVALGMQLDVYDALELKVTRESEVLANTRDELLPLLMSGKLRVKDAEKLAEEVR
jgi:type I restriction enzyme S subunit